MLGISITPPSVGGLSGLSASIIDMLTTGKKVVDRDLQGAPTLIAATSKPVSPQFTYTLLSANIPTVAVDATYQAYISYGGKNTDAVDPHDVNMRLTLNGVEVGVSDEQITAVDPTTPFWYAIGVFATAPVAAGDVLGIKLWCDTTNKIDLRYVSIYVVVRTLAPSSTQFFATPTVDPVYKMPVTGAIAGVTYDNVATPNNDRWKDAALGGSVDCKDGMLFGNPLEYFQGTLTDSTVYDSNANQDAAAKLYKDTGMLRYFYLYQ